MTDERFPTNLEAVEHGPSAEATEMMNLVEVLEDKPEPSEMKDALKKAKALLKTICEAKKYTNAFEYIELIQKNVPEDNDLKFVSGVCLMETGNLERAESLAGEIRGRFKDDRMGQYMRRLAALQKRAAQSQDPPSSDQVPEKAKRDEDS